MFSQEKSKLLMYHIALGTYDLSIIQTNTIANRERVVQVGGACRGEDEDDVCWRVERQNQYEMSLVARVLPTSTRNVIFVSLSNLFFLKKMFHKKVDQPTWVNKHFLPQKTHPALCFTKIATKLIKFYQDGILNKARGGFTSKGESRI